MIKYKLCAHVLLGRIQTSKFMHLESVIMNIYLISVDSITFKLIIVDVDIIITLDLSVKNLHLNSLNLPVKDGEN